MIVKPLPSVEYLRECFDLDRATGVLVWRSRPRNHFQSDVSWSKTNCRQAGKAITSRNAAGYIRAAINGDRYYVHRIVLKMISGVDPPPEIDHRDGDRSNNSPDNLRPASHQENLFNQRRRCTNLVGAKGVWKKRGKFVAAITRDGKSTHLGTFDTLAEAASAYAAASQLLHGDFGRSA